jgi:hypothetical protein
MNGLSWLFLGAEWAGSIKGITLALCILGSLVSLGALIFLFVVKGYQYSDENDHGYRTRYKSYERDSQVEKYLEILKTLQNSDNKIFKKIFGWAFSIFFLCLVVTSITPSSKTIYMIAASELGESVLQNTDIPELAADYIELLRAQLGVKLENITQAVTE